MIKITIIGGGLAGSEAALQLAKKEIHTDLYEMRPNTQTGAHVTDYLGELVCSNSLGSNDPFSASGLLKQELRLMGSYLIKYADECRVSAGNALAVDRNLFAQKITEEINKNPYINVIKEEITDIPADTPVIIASGPLTSERLTRKIIEFTGTDNLYFFDAIAPVIEKDSIDFEKAFFANRYNKGDEAAYINCPMDKDEYEIFYEKLTNSPTIELKEFEKGAKFFESCLPVEVLGKRGKDTLRYGPMKPVGLIDPRTNRENYAVVQLRQDNKAATLYNMVGFQTNLKWGAQKELIRLIPGLENANIARYGVMHRNTFIHSPSVLTPAMNTQNRTDLFFGGQLTGVEGYTESIATGMLAGINAARHTKGETLLTLPATTMLGGLCAYITFPEHKNFQPVNSNWGLLDPPIKQKNKKLRHEMLAKRALGVYENNLVF